MKKLTLFATIQLREIPIFLPARGIAFQSYRWLDTQHHKPCDDLVNWIARRYPCRLEFPSPWWQSTPDLSAIRRRY